MSGLAETFRKLGSRAMQANAKCSGRAAENDGRVGRAQSLPGDEPQHLALRIAELGKGSTDLAAFRQNLGWVAAELDAGAGQATMQAGASLGRAAVIGEHLVADAEQPWERGFRHLIATPPRDRKSFGENILGSATVLESSHHIAAKLRVVVPERGIELALVGEPTLASHQ